MAKENNFAAADLTIGQINALVKKMGGKERVMDFLAGRLRLTDFFEKRDEMIVLDKFCIFSRVLQPQEQEIYMVGLASPEDAHVLYKELPKQGITCMGYNALLIMHTPIQSKQRGVSQTQYVIFSNGVYDGGFRRKNEPYPKGWGFVYIKKN